MSLRPKAVRLLAAIGPVVLLLGCGQPDLRELPRDATVVAFGDSLTFGTGAGRGRGYPEVLAQRTGLKVVNAGAPGELSADGLRRLPGVLAEHHPSLVILCHGGNDLLRGGGDASLARNLAAMITLARDSGSQVLLVAPPQPRITMKPPSLYQQVADELGVPCDAETLPRIMGTPAMMGEDIHPNARGYAELARVLTGRIRVRRD